MSNLALQQVPPRDPHRRSRAAFPHLVVPDLSRHSGPPASKRLLDGLVAGLHDLGVDVTAPLARFGLTVDALERIEEGELRWSFLHDFWNAVRETSGEAALGLRLGERYGPERYDLFGTLLRASSTLGDALVRAVRFLPLFVPDVELSFQVEGGTAVVVLRPLDPELFHPESTEFLLAAIRSVGSTLAGRTLMPREVHLAHAPPPNLAHHRRAFDDRSIRFNATRNAYLFDSAVLGLRIQTHDAALCARLEEAVSGVIQDVPRPGSFTRRVEASIAEELRSGNPSLEGIASKLRIHPKTLARRLRAEGTSHREVIDGLRSRLALRYIRDPAATVTVITALLGYSDPSSFHKAFRRWTGVAPVDYRLGHAS